MSEKPDYVEQAIMSADDRSLMLGLLRRCDVRSKRMADGRVRLLVYLHPEQVRVAKRRRAKTGPLEGWV